jgi:uncharacterized protein (TIGR02646 family)
MIQLPSLPLAQTALDKLVEYQDAVDDAPTYAERVERAKKLFAQRNTKTNATFREVKRVLDAMCSGARRCCYCEDSMADEVEHIRPKDLYPELVFAWTNYLYACGPCNGPKNNQFAVFPVGSDVPLEVSRGRNGPVVPPASGDEVLIDPRREDPTAFMVLDLRSTFRFVELAPEGTRDHARAEYTIRVLGLNARDVLPRARREAYDDYVARIVKYRTDRDAGASAADLRAQADALVRKQHPTVWREMKRQAVRIPALQALFAAVPEALAW